MTPVLKTGCILESLREFKNTDAWGSSPSVNDLTGIGYNLSTDIYF